jgi:SAM-dependent methyltransferase
MARTMAVSLPPRDLRWGGSRLDDDRLYVGSAVRLAVSVGRLVGLNDRSRVLDIGCGAGRLLIGIAASGAYLGRYVGVDTFKPAVDWAARALVAPWVEFRAVETFNARYNETAPRPTTVGFLPFVDGEFDQVVLHSVFSHMTVDDVALYLAETARLLEPGGRAYCTAFVEDDVPEWTENPEDYGGPWRRPLHCVRINRQAFERLVAAAGLVVLECDRRTGPEQQTRYALAK